MEKDGCGVGFLVSLKNERSHATLKLALDALDCMEHRGGVGPDSIGDGAGVMTSIPFELFQREPGTFAVASLLIPKDLEKRKKSLAVFEETFWQFGLKVSGYRQVPIDPSVLSQHALQIMPEIIQAVVERPHHCRTLYSFERLLYTARQTTRTKEKENGIYQEFYFNSLSARTIIYKALCKSPDLKKFYLDLQNSAFETNFALFHRRFSTNTISTWDKTQPFRLIAHNGEINTIEGNRAWAITREKAMGLMRDELITHEGISDSGNLNGIAEGLRYRSSIPKLAETMAILMPPANETSDYYKFWGRGMEPWDGPAMVTFSDGKTIGARLDRNGFRPCRWQQSEDYFFLSSETGVFNVATEKILSKGALSSGESVTINVYSGAVSFLDPKDFPENKSVRFDPNTVPLGYLPPPQSHPQAQHEKDLRLFRFSREEVERLIIPMTVEGKEPLGSMGDTACLPFLSEVPRSIFDFFYQDFAQVTNPPLDYIREKVVTDMRVYLGRKPNIFEPKDFIPLKPGIELSGPVLSLGQMDHLYSLKENPAYPDLKSFRLDLTYPKGSSVEDFLKRLETLLEESITALKHGFSLIVLSHRNADAENLPVPSILALTYLNLGLNNTGRRLRTSLIMDVGDARNSHQIACLLGHGASSVCPYVALRTAIGSEDPKLENFFDHERESRLIKALSDGILRIMAKRGISVFRSYQGSKLFTPLGLSQEVLDVFFKGKKSVLGGLNLRKLLGLHEAGVFSDDSPLPSLFLFKEQASGKSGENHSMTSRRSRAIHKMLQEEDFDKAFEAFKVYSEECDSPPLLIRHLLRPRVGDAIDEAKVESVTTILSTFGSGAMSFGALSAESQRDLILAFREIKGRSNSGEGGENPFYETEGITSTVKQLASGRFGVTAEYLVNGNEVQIKIAQGAKPGEGGQLMGIKVTDDIAKARFTTPGVDLISPPPQHDIYSIEDLKELIYELKQLSPTVKVSVKLVSGDNIGAISVGVAKAGADVIQISGGDGGTGAASLLSMKHAGLPLEVGLLEVHQALVQNDMRDRIRLRADGGFTTGKDLVIAALLGADEFDFGKLLLVGQGCIMARVCEKNTCPTGIATHAPKFKAFYKGDKDKVVTLLKCLATEVREILRSMGKSSLREITGMNHLLELNQKHEGIIRNRGIDLTNFTKTYAPFRGVSVFAPEASSTLNAEVIKELGKKNEFTIRNFDRAIPATLYGMYALKAASEKTAKQVSHPGAPALPESIDLIFRGSAGQGFAVFNVSQVRVRLEGEANDSVAKGMSGGQVVIVPPKTSAPDFKPEENTIIGNCALYGATGGRLFVLGKAGDRFAVRNSQAEAVVGSVGFHACEYMSGGRIWIIGLAKGNIGAGMSGGMIFTLKENLEMLNQDYVTQVPIGGEDLSYLRKIGEEYVTETGSEAMKEILAGDHIRQHFIKVIPKLKL